MTTVARHFLANHGIRVADSQKVTIQALLTSAFEVFVHRIVTFVSMVTLAHGTRKVTEAHVYEALRLLDRPSKKKHMRGGTVMAGDYFGVPHPAYGSGYQDTNSTTIDFYNGTAREELGSGMAGGAGAAHHAVLLQMMKDNFKLHKMTVSKGALSALNGFVSVKVHELSAALKTTAQLTKPKLVSVLGTKKFAIFI